MPTIIKINEGYAVEQSSAFINVTFYDEDDDLVVPDSITWTLTDENGTIINEREDEAVSVPASSITIVLTGDDLAFLSGETADAVNRILMIEAVYDSDLQEDLAFKDAVVFPLVNLVAIANGYLP